MDHSYEEKYHILETQNWWFLSRRARICDMLSDVPRNAAILDVGCSSGHLLRDLRALGFENLTGIDVSETGVKIAVNDGFDCSVMDGQDTTFDPNTFDFIIASDSLEHMEYDTHALENWHKILRPGGRIIVYVPAFMSLWSGHDVVNHHFRRYTANELKLKATAARFEITSDGYWNFFLFFPIYAVRKIKSITEGKNALPKDDLKNIGFISNAVLKAILNLENRIARIFRLPVGVSAFIEAKKPLA